MSAATLSTGLQAVAALLVLLIVFAGLRRSPKVAVFVWLFVICFVPIWIGQTVVAYFPAFVIVSLLAAISLLPTVSRVRWSVADGIFVAVAIVVVAEYAVGLTTRSGTFDLVVNWGSAFLLGRIVTAVLDPRWIYSAIAVFFSVVAALALAEFALGTNPFTTLLANNTASYALWGGLQPRGTILRAEGAFGHSIALGSSLGVAAAMTMGSRFRPWLRTAMLGLIVGGAVVSFSRTGMITAGLGIVLACLFLREPLSRRYRTTMLIAALAAAAAVFITIQDVFLASGDEAEGSALYRSELLQLIGYIRPLGLAANFTVSTNAQVSIGEFGSVDNALLLFGLTFGWVPSVLVLLMLVVAAGYLLRRRATPAVIAVLAQSPALVTVAFITQYAAVFWFAAGLAVSTQVLANTTAGRRSTPKPLPVGAALVSSAA